MIKARLLFVSKLSGVLLMIQLEVLILQGYFQKWYWLHRQKIWLRKK